MNTSRGVSSNLNFSSFFFNDTATTEIYTLSLHDALPILVGMYAVQIVEDQRDRPVDIGQVGRQRLQDRKSTRLNSSHTVISYAVFCLKKKIVGDLARFIRLKEKDLAQAFIRENPHTNRSR